MIKKRLLISLFALIVGSPSYAKTVCNAAQGIALVNHDIGNIAELNRIVSACDQAAPNSMQTLLLHGLIARKEALTTQNFQAAIDWLTKAKQAATPDDTAPALELAVTYEWANQFDQAKLIYLDLLKRNDALQSAWLGLARVAAAKQQFDEAKNIYTQLLQKNPHDFQALNGLANIELALGQKDDAKAHYEQVLQLIPNNPDATQGLQKITASEPTFKLSPLFCQANKGLQLLTQPNVNLNQLDAILRVCDKELPNNATVLLLHGLVERKRAIPTQHFQPAITWFKKATQRAEKNNLAPMLELAVTYEWAGQFDNADAIYDAILKRKRGFRPALLGSARVAAYKKEIDLAINIYQSLLVKNPNDIDALNGLARVKLIQKQDDEAKKLFTKVLQIHPNDAEAELGLKQIAASAVKPQTIAKTKPPVILCEANEGLRLLNEPKPPYQKIDAILAKCDKNTPHDVQALLLHGLLARKYGMATKQYQTAIIWLKQAALVAAPDNDAPALELAVTYEWSGRPQDAALIYQKILAKNPPSRPALLGMARIYLATYQIKKATAIYEELLANHPHDKDALNGLAWVQLSNKDFKGARQHFEQVLSLDANNAEAKQGLALLQELTRYVLTIDGGQYSVGKTSSKSASINFYADINATDQLLFQATHNSKEIQLSLVLDPTILPKNSLLAGYQHQIPNRYGWGVSYEYRERLKFPVEHRIALNANVFFLDNLQWFIGGREGFPSPWNNQLFLSSLTWYTSLPVNFTLTGYWGIQQTGGGNSAYSFDLSREFANRAFYNAGTSYSPSQKSWSLHGRFILPLFKNQGLEGLYEHDYFNDTTIYSLGWRIYF